MMRQRMRVLRSVTLVLAAACADVVGPHALIGSWGGDGAGLIVTPAEAQLWLNCGAGRLDVPINVHGDGRFVTMGVTWFVGGAPPPDDIVPVMIRTRFSGRLVGNLLVLTVTPDDPRLGVGGETTTYGLKRNAPPRVFACP
jgi:hypothetical protein